MPEQIVVTHFSGTINYYAVPPIATPNLGNNGFVVSKFDTQTGNIGPLIPPTTSPPGLWDPGDAPPYSSFHNETGQPWTAQRLGEVFGITVDDASPPNIYVTATEAYNIVGSSTPLPKGAGGAGGIYRLDGTTGLSSSGSLPNNSVNGPGLGNVCFRRAGSGTGYLYASDLEDGKIYRVDAATLLQVGSPFDHGVQGRPNMSLPTIVDDGTPGLTQFGRRIWGVKTYQNKLYYAVWWEDSRNVSATESNEVWTVTLDNNGDFIPATAQRIISIPNFSNYQWSHPIASIDFSPNGKMFLAERYWQYLGMIMNSTFGAHHTRILRYWLSGPTWVTDPTPTYQIGGDPTVYFGNNMPGANSAGGVAVNCDESVWATGDMYAGSYSTPPNIPFGVNDLGYVYGALRIPTGGNSMYAGLGYGSFAIDYDMNTNSIAKFGVGAIATVRNCCTPPPASLAAWWPLDELTGATTYADLSGNGNTAIIESGGPLGSFQSPGATLGKVAGASSFINSPNRGRAPDSASLNFGTGSFSLDCWVRPAQTGPPSWQTIVDKLNTGNSRGYTVGISNMNLTLILGDGTIYTHIGPAVNGNVWNFVGVVVNRTANTVQFFVNGVAATPQALAATGNLNNAIDLLIGAPYTPNIVSETSIDELELFNRALATNELSDLWLADSIGKCKSGQPPCTNGVVTIVCPTNITVACAPIVFYPPPQASTTCGTITNVVCTPPSGSSFPLGPTIVTCTAYNSLGNSNSCTFTVNVGADTTPPVIDCACLNYVSHEALNVSGCQAVVPDLCNYLSFSCVKEDCCLGICVQNPSAGTPVGPGSTPITWTIFDCAGNSNSCTLILTVTAPPEGCTTPCTNKMAFLSLAISPTNGVFSGANGTIVAQTAGGPFLSLNNTAYGSKFPNLFLASGIVTGYLAQVDLNGSLTATFWLTNYTITPGTMFGIWNITEETNIYSIAVYDCSSTQLAPPFGSSFSFLGWDDDSLSGNIGWYHMTLNPSTGLLATAPFAGSGMDCDAAFWTNIPPNACRIVVSRSKGAADGVVFYFGEPQLCCEIACPTNVTVTTCGTGAVVTYPPPVMSNCPPGSSVICSPPSGSNFPLGTNIVTCSVINSVGTAAASCHFTVTVLPKTPAVSITCPNPTISINITGCPPVMPNLSNYITITTNCPPPCPITVQQSIPPGTPLTAGTHVAIVNICICQTNCRVCDVTIKAYSSTGNPTITCPPNQVIVTCGTNAVANYKIKASGFNGPIVCSPPSGTLLPLGTTVVTCTVTNACGGVASCSFTVTVKRPTTRWPCDWQVGIGIPYQPVGDAITALRAVDPGSPAICIFPNLNNPNSGTLLHFGQAQAVTFTTELDFTAAVGAGMDFVLPPGPNNSNNIPLLSFRSKGPKGYCVKSNKRFADNPNGLFRATAVNTNGQLLDSITLNSYEMLTNEYLVIGFQPGVTSCHVTVELDCYSGVMSVEFSGPVTASTTRKGWDGCIYGPDRPVKKPTSKVYFIPPTTPGEPPVTDLNLFASGLAEVGLEEPSITAAGRKWGDGHVTLMKAYDDGEGMEFAVLSNQGEPVSMDLGHTESFDLRLTKFETNALPGEELLTRTIGPITGLPTQPPFLDELLLKESGGHVECSADFSNLGSPTVRVQVFNNGVLVAGRTGVPGVLDNPLLILPTWPDRLGKLGGSTPCRRGKIPLGSIMLPGNSAGQPPTMVDGDEFRILAELPPGAPHPDYYSAFNFFASEDGDWGVTELTRTTICVPTPVAIARASGAVTVTWSGQNFRLQGSERVNGPWFELGTESPVQLPATSAARFFRLVCD